MGRKVTIYLTDAEFSMLEKICQQDGHQNMTKVLKQSLVQMFEGAYLTRPHKDELGNLVHEPYLFTDQRQIEEASEEDLQDLGAKRWKCPKCGRFKLIPDEEVMAKWSDDKLEEKGLKKWRCPECGKMHIAGMNELIILESEEDRKKRELEQKKAAAKAEADKMIESLNPADELAKNISDTLSKGFMAPSPGELIKNKLGVRSK